MKCDIVQSDLLKALKIAGKAVPGKPTHPILACFHLEITSIGLAIQSNDLTISIATIVPATNNQDGECCVPARLFTGLIEKLNTGEVISLESLEEALEINTSTGQYTIPLQKADEFPKPELSKAFEECVNEISADQLQLAYQYSSGVVSQDDFKGPITGVLINIDESNEELKAVGTDGHRLNQYQGKTLSECIKSMSCLIDPLAINVALMGEESTVMIDRTENQVILKNGSIIVSTSEVAGQYPSVNNLIPKEFKSKFSLKRKNLLKAVERINLVASQSGGVLVISREVGRQSIILCSEHESATGVESVDAVFKDDKEWKVGLNSRYLLDALKVIETDDIDFGVTGERTPVVITNMNNEDESGICVLMPVVLSK